MTNDDKNENIQLAGYTLHLNSVGYGRGLATYYKQEKFKHCDDVKQKFFQLTKLISSDIDIISIYRSKECSEQELIIQIKKLIEGDKPTIVCGDLNLCSIDENANAVTKALEAIGFSETAQCATHIKGGHIDHMYFR